MSSWSVARSGFAPGRAAARRVRIAIVGAGFAGMAAALAARQHGLEVMVFEKAADFSRVAGGVLLHSNGLRVLDALGVLDLCAPIMRPSSLLTVERPGGRRLARFDYRRCAVPHNRAAVVLRQELLEFLLSAAEWHEIPIAFGQRCSGVSWDAAGATVFFANGGEYECDIVLACDGVHSRVCERGGLRATITTSGEAFVRGVAEWRADDPTIREIYASNGRRFGIYPLPGSRTAFACTVPVGMWRRIVGAQLDFWVESWQSHGPEVVEILQSVREWDRVSYHEVHEVSMPRWWQGRIFAVGDAAHAMRPTLGQGPNAALVDALVLMRLLAPALHDGHGLAAVGRRYQQIRRPFVRRTQRAARRLDPAQWSVARGLLRRFLPLPPGERRLRAGFNPREKRYFALPSDGQRVRRLGS